MPTIERVAATFKIDRETKRRVDLMASALGVEKSTVIREAVELLAERRRAEMQAYLDDARSSFSGKGVTLGEAFTGRRRGRAYAGGPVPR